MGAVRLRDAVGLIVLSLGSLPSLAQETAWVVASQFGGPGKVFAINTSVSPPRVEATIPIGRQTPCTLVDPCTPENPVAHSQSGALTPDGQELWVANEGSNSISIMSTRERRIVHTITALCDYGYESHPRHIVFSPNGRTAYVSTRCFGETSDNQVAVVDVPTRGVTALWDVGFAPIGLAISRDGSQLYVANFGSAAIPTSRTVKRIETSSGNVRETAALWDSPGRLAWAPDQSTLYVVLQGPVNSFVALHPWTLDVRFSVNNGRAHIAAASTPDGRYVYASVGGLNGDVSVFDISSRTYLGGILTGDAARPMGVAISRNGGSVYVANYTLDTVSVISTATRRVVATIDVDSDPDVASNPRDIILQESPVRTLTVIDFDGDGRTDVSYFRPQGGVWEARLTSGGVFQYSGFGGPGDKPVPEDYDGDGITDIGLRRSNGLWFYRQSSDGQSITIPFGGLSTDKPVPGDYDGDGKADLGLFRGGTWFIRRSTTGTDQVVVFGGSSDIPVPADFDGDGKTDIAVYRPNAGWYILRSSDGVPETTAAWGGWVYGVLDQAVPADFDGDGKADVAVWRPSTGTWFVRRSSDGLSWTYVWGGPGDRPVLGYYDSDLRSDFGVFRAGGLWFQWLSGGGWLEEIALGTGSADVPLSRVLYYQ